jgi:hypothetical protein
MSLALPEVYVYVTARSRNDIKSQVLDQLRSQTPLPGDLDPQTVVGCAWQAAKTHPVHKEDDEDELERGELRAWHVRLFTGPTYRIVLTMAPKSLTPSKDQ